jgi:L-histidine Nalpha-methyltransferase
MKATIAPSGRHDEIITRRGQFLNDVVHGLGRPQKLIPCKYLYDERGSALFDQICELEEYYLTRAELAILGAHAAEMADLLGEDCELIEFGSGSATKTRLLLEHLKAPRAYLPVDIAKEHLERSAHALALSFPAVPVVPVAADFTVPLTLPEIGDSKARRVVYFPGSTIGNFSVRAAIKLLNEIADLVGPGGGLLIGLDVDKDASIVWPAYNDRAGVTAAFNLNLLERANRELGARFELASFTHRADYVRSKERVEMHLVSRKRQQIKIAGIDFTIEQDETIHTENSYKYSPARFRHMTALAGFVLRRQWLDPRRYFAVQYLTVA